ncbi:hypothetical protein Q3G72_004603 [Acer saccharum]|nr:hypothetical protein Q3G72_004603 [Acer saccharum]
MRKKAYMGGVISVPTEMRMQGTFYSKKLNKREKQKYVEEVKEEGGKRGKDYEKGSGFRNSKCSLGSNKGMGGNLGNGGLGYLSLAEISNRRRLLQKTVWGVVLELISKRTWDVVLIGTSPLCGHDSSKDGNGSDLMSGKVGGPSIDIFVDLRGQVSGVEIGEHVSSQFKASNRRGSDQTIIVPN